MNDWKKVKLGEVCKIKSGKRLPKGCEFSDTPTKYKYIRARDIKNGIINGEELAYITEETQYKISKYIVNSDDIVITIVGASVGDVAYISSQYNGVNLTENAVRLTQFNTDVNSRYLFYILNSPNYYQLMQRIAGGAAQPKMGIYKVEAIEVYLPSLSTQQRIATILSRYDSLIENYQKQIKLLEESAQRLYKEWFIDLRFPGHENTKIVDGVPDGWEKKCVDSIYSIKYGKNLSTKLIEEKGDYPVYGANGVIGYYSEANCNEQVVLITSRGNGSGDVLMTYHKEAFITNNSFIVTPLEEYLYCQLPFTYQFLKCANFRNVRTGAAQPQLTNQSIHTIDVILPTKDVIVEFCKKTDSNNSLIINLKKDIHHLTEARDRLLPKLMSGEIEV